MKNDTNLLIPEASHAPVKVMKDDFFLTEEGSAEKALEALGLEIKVSFVPNPPPVAIPVIEPHPRCHYGGAD